MNGSVGTTNLAMCSVVGGEPVVEVVVMIAVAVMKDMNVIIMLVLDYGGKMILVYYYDHLWKWQQQQRRQPWPYFNRYVCAHG